MCTNPIHINKNLPDGRVRSVVVPCGNCPECLKRRQSAIVVRSYIESCKRPKVCMFTLTYNENNLPHNEYGEATLRREDIKNWKKDFRKLIFSNDFSWICSGEYSPRGWHRPHYHGIFFGLDSKDLRIIENSWSKKYGFTVFKQVPCVSHKDLLNVSRYISKYVVKDEEFRTPSLTVEKPRLMASVGFGEPSDEFWNYVLCFDKFQYDPFEADTITNEIVLAVLDRLWFTIDGFKYSIPQYAIRKKLYYKDSTQALRKSALLKMVSFFKKFRSYDVRYRKFRQFCSANPSRPFSESIVAFDNLQEVLKAEKSDSQRKDIISTYKKSLI